MILILFLRDTEVFTVSDLKFPSFETLLAQKLRLFRILASD